MATENEVLQAQTKINRQNADAKELGTQINALAVVYGDRVNTSAGDDAVIAIANSVIDLFVQADITFPVVKFDGHPTPEILSAEVGDAASTLVSLQYNTEVALTDETGFTISGSTLATSITFASVQGDKSVVHLTCNDAVANGETILITYASGNIVSLADGDAAIDQADVAVTNNVA